MLLVVLSFFQTAQIDVSRAYCSPYFNSWADFELLGCSPLGESMTALTGRGIATTLLAALAGRALATLMAFVAAALAQLSGKYIRILMNRLSEAMMTIPSLLLALAFGFIWGSGTMSMILAIAFSEWAYNEKWLLGRLKEYRRHDYVAVALSMGAGPWHIFSEHFKPVLIKDLIFLFFVYLPGSLLTVAALEFLGLSSGGRYPGLGYYVAAYKDMLFIYPHIILAPVVLLVAIVMAAVSLKNRFQVK